MAEQDRLLISTVLLNWNRHHLLEMTIKSYLDTISVPYELIIIDNGSIDGSREYIKKVCHNNKECDCILLDKNIGGKALNLGLQKARGKFMHVSENDLSYKVGWDTKMLKKFQTFPELGQLSVFSPFPPDGVIWEKMKFTNKFERSNFIIYVTDINVGSSSVFRWEIWDKGIRWGNTGKGEYQFPNDGAFSQAVQKAGYLVAWNDEYLVKNHGHHIEEMKNNLSYYIKDYQAKPRGLSLLKNRLLKNGYKLEKDLSTESGYKIELINN